MIRLELGEKGPFIRDWLDQRSKELMETGRASLVIIHLKTGLESISDPPACNICNNHTEKAVVSHNVTSFDQKLIVATANMPGYRCNECRERPDLVGRTTHYARSFRRDVGRILEQPDSPGTADGLIYILGAYARGLREAILQQPEYLEPLHFLSREGLSEFSTRAADIFQDRGYIGDAGVFRQAGAR